MLRHWVSCDFRFASLPCRPPGFRTDRPAKPILIPGALAWYLTLQHRGRLLTIQEYAIFNNGAFAHPTDPNELLPLFPTARAISADPLLLEPSTG